MLLRLRGGITLLARSAVGRPTATGTEAVEKLLRGAFSRGASRPPTLDKLSQKRSLTLCSNTKQPKILGNAQLIPECAERIESNLLGCLRCTCVQRLTSPGSGRVNGNARKTLVSQSGGITERKRLFTPQRGGLGKQIGYPPRSGANNRSSCAIRPAAGWTREAVMLFAPQLGE